MRFSSINLSERIPVIRVVDGGKRLGKRDGEGEMAFSAGTGILPLFPMKRLGIPKAALFLALLGSGFLVAIAAGDEAVPSAKAATGGRNGKGDGSVGERKQIVLPGLVVNLAERCVDVEASICLHEGTLELIACTKDSKEHESILVVGAKPSHIHASLLLLGALPGNPAMRQPIGDEGARWIDMPPKGDTVAVYLLFENPAGETVEHPISDFIAPAEEESEPTPNTDAAKTDRKNKFSESFIFAGSILRGNGSGPREYLSDQSGNVISLVTFGDELLCLSGMHDQDNGALMWQINSANLPEVGTKVTLRLCPRSKASQQVEKPAAERPFPPPATGRE